MMRTLAFWVFVFFVAFGGSAMALPEFSTSGVPQGSIEELARIYREASKRLRQMVLHPTGGTDAAQEFRRARAIALSDQVDQVLLALKRRVSPWASKNALAAVREGRATAERQAREAGVRVQGAIVGGSFHLVEHRAVGYVARQIAMDLNQAADSMGDRAKRLLRKTAQEGLDETKINRILAGGIIEGTPAATIRTLREELRAVHGDTVQVIDKNGDPINFEVGYYASLVACTQTRTAMVDAKHERLEAIGLDLVAIVGRISENFCTAYLGEVYSLSGKHPKYPAYASLPSGGAPFH
ncbi:MAG: hypothetical protein ACM359_06760, partial [Bacillota bacterium]